MISPLAYTCDYTVQTYDIEIRRRMTVAALVKLMQEAAMQNVMQLKLSVWDMEAHHISWVLLRKHLQINRLPMIGETLRVCTCPAGFERIFTYRDYKIFDATGELIAWSSSTWLLLNTQTRKMERLPAFILRFEKDMPPVSECLPRPTSVFSPPERVDFQLDFRVNWHDLDFNGHLNNAFYLQWMLEAMPDEALESWTLQSFDIQYKIEGQWKDEIRSETEQTGERTFRHRLVRTTDGKELAVGMSEW